MDAHVPVIGITMGDPAGIGPEITLRVLANPDIHKICRPVVLGDRGVLERTRQAMGIDVRIACMDAPEAATGRPGVIDLLPISELAQSDARWGTPTPAAGQAMVRYVLAAVDLAMAHRLAAVVTCPINKHAMNMAGFSYNGHTELLAEKTGCADYAMMMAGPKLRVVLVSIHRPLREVPDHLSIEGVFAKIRITHRSLQERFACRRPNIAVAGLNPHAGEECLFGTEDAEIIRPAVRRAQASGWQVEGPVPADTVFYRALQGEFDAVVAMYHDQGLIPFKLVHFSDGVNTTIGLPIIRTSVDHGTAYDIAGTGRADPSSLKAAVEMAALQSRALRFLQDSP